MPSEAMDKWLTSGRPALIGSHRLKPAEHAYAKGKPLSAQKGQAEAFFLTDDEGHGWILKKFRQPCVLDPAYLRRVAALLPKESAFVCGTDRQILATGALQKVTGYHESRDLDRWLDGTILMPRVKGADWACLADDVRAGGRVLEPAQRLTLCRNLTRLVALLEACRCCHRDLSCGNIFIEIATGDISLIDFDSLFHPSLALPQATTCGSEGYTAPYLWNGRTPDPRRSWCEKADRYALALLNTELLLIKRGTVGTAEGGMFQQEELREGRGPGIDAIAAELKTRYPGAAALLLQAIRSRRPGDCPAPQAWSSALQDMPSKTAGLPTLANLPDPADGITDLLARVRPAIPVGHVPKLDDLPVTASSLPLTQSLFLNRWGLQRTPWSKRPTF